MTDQTMTGDLISERIICRNTQHEIHAEALRGALEEQVMGRFDRVESRFTQVDHELSDIKSDLRLLKWMVTFNLAITVAVLWMLIRA